MKAVSRGAFAIVMILGSALSASAQSLVDHTAFAGVRFGADSATNALASPTPVRTTAAAVPRQGSGMTWNGVVLGGLSNNGLLGFAIGAGVQASNVAGKDEFGLQIDAIYSNNGGCAGCDFDLDGDTGYSANTISVAGAFIYKFKETSGGWRPFAGAGVVFSRFSYGFDGDDDFYCDLIGGCSATNVGVQAQGGIGNGKFHFEGRVQHTVGGSFLALAGYKFGGS